MRMPGRGYGSVTSLDLVRRKRGYGVLLRLPPTLIAAASSECFGLTLVAGMICLGRVLSVVHDVVNM